MDFGLLFRAFLVGGGICVIGQLLIEYTAFTPARILVSFVCLGVLLTGLGVYEPLVHFAGAGATVPLTGFGYLLATGTKEAVDLVGLRGVLTGGITAAAGGLAAAILCGFLCGLAARPKAKM